MLSLEHEELKVDELGVAEHEHVVAAKRGGVLSVNCDFKGGLACLLEGEINGLEALASK